MAKRHTTTTATLPGDWRRRRGSSTDVHLWAKVPNRTEQRGTDQPMCGRRIPRRATNPAVGRPCTGCLVAALTSRS